MVTMSLFEPRTPQQMPLDFEAPREIRNQERYLQINRELDYWEELKWIAARRDLGIKRIKRILGDLREGGYDIKPYSQMIKPEALKYLREVRHDISSHLAELHYEEHLLR